MKLPNLQLDYRYRGEGWCDGMGALCEMPGRVYTPVRPKGLAYVFKAKDGLLMLCKACCVKYEAKRKKA